VTAEVSLSNSLAPNPFRPPMKPKINEDFPSLSRALFVARAPDPGLPVEQLPLDENFA